MGDLGQNACNSAAARRLSGLSLETAMNDAPGAADQQYLPSSYYNSSNVSEDTQRTADHLTDDRHCVSTSSSSRLPPSSLAVRRVAEALYAQKRTDECLRMLEREASMSLDPDALFLRALCCLEKKQHVVSFGLLGQALSVRPGHVPSLTTYAELQKNMGQLDAALVTMEVAYRIACASNRVHAGEGCGDEDGQGEGEDCNVQNGGRDQVDDVDTYPNNTSRDNDDKHGDDEERRTAETVRRAYAGILVEAGTAEKMRGGSSWAQKYARAIEVCPEFAPVHYNLGVAASDAGDVRGALVHYRRAVELDPEYVEALCKLGVILQLEGRLQEAIEAYEKAHLVASAVQVGTMEGSGAGLFEHAVLTEGASPGVHHQHVSSMIEVVAKNLALALNHHGTHVKVHERDPERAMKLYERAVAVSPGCSEALYNLGVIYAEFEEVDKAIFAYRSTIKENPGCAAAHNNLGVLYRNKGLMGLALQCYEAAIRVQPKFPQALNNLAVMYTQQGRAQEALDLLHAAIVADPGYPEAWNNLGVLQRDVGEAEDAVQSYQKCIDLSNSTASSLRIAQNATVEGPSKRYSNARGDMCSDHTQRDEQHQTEQESRQQQKTPVVLCSHRNAGQNLLLGLNYLYDGNESVICDAHMAWGRAFQEAHELFEPVPRNHRARNHERIRVGYVSPDLFVHSVSYFAEAPITSHDTAQFEVTVYSVCVNPDAKTARLRREVQTAGGCWKDVAELTERQLAELVREDEIDILVDLTGHTANNRLGTFAMRPAPVQVTWIGYPNTTGLQSIDYRITDSLCDPVTTTQVFSEQLVRLEKCFLCYKPCPESPEVAPLPADTNGYITFGSFNALAKQTPEVLETWAEILRAVPRSRLVLKNKPFASHPVKEKFWELFERLGVDRSRIDLLPLAPKTESHLQQYSMLDVCLDPFPYAGTTTTMEALYMGVPCLTMRGLGHAHNVGVSLVTNVGLRGDWIADDRCDYVSKAVKASEDVAGLRRLRRGLRQRVVESAICDVRAFMRDFESRLIQMTCKT